MAQLERRYLAYHEADNRDEWQKNLHRADERLDDKRGLHDYWTREDKVSTRVF